MNKTKTRNLTCAALVIAVCFIIGAISAFIPFGVKDYKYDAQEDIAVDSMLYNITYDNSNSLGRLQDKAMYTFTDKDIYDKYRAGTKNSDTTIIYVD